MNSTSPTHRQSSRCHATQRGIKPYSCWPRSLKVRLRSPPFAPLKSSYKHCHHPASRTNQTFHPAKFSLPMWPSSALAHFCSFPKSTSASTSWTSNTSALGETCQSNSIAISRLASEMQVPRRKEKRPDWHLFDKYRPFKEVIIKSI